MASGNDTTTTLNPGVGGDSLDESAVYDKDGTLLGKRARVVLGGEQSRNAVVEPVLVGAGQYGIPVLLDPSAFNALMRIEGLLREMLTELRRDR
jgi:hypothetical protein